MRVEFYTTTRDRVCKICNLPIPRGERGIQMYGVHISPKIRNLHFHEVCFRDAVKEVM